MSFAIPTFSYAAIIDGYFNGRVYMDESDEGVWSTSLRGKKVSGYFSYDTSLAPAANPDYPYATSYSSATNSWLNLIYYIDGKKIDISSMGDKDNLNGLDGEGVGISDTDEDVFYLGDSITSGNISTNYREVSGGIYIGGKTNFLNTDSLLQNFIWENTGTYAATASLRDWTLRDGAFYGTYFEMYISKINVSVRKEASVAEPSAAILFALGLLGLIMNYRRHW